MSRPTEHPTVGYLLWRVTTRMRAAVDRALGPLGLTHAQYTLLASLYGYSRSGARPSQRELADWTGLEPIFVSKLARALEQRGLLSRDTHPADPRAVQLGLTDSGAETAERAIAIVHALQEELTASIGGTRGQRARDLVSTLETLLGSNDRSDDMAPPATLTGQDVGEAEGALSALLTRVLAVTDSGLRRTEYLALRVLAARGPTRPPAAIHEFLASQPQVGLDLAQVGEQLAGLEARGLVSGSDPAGPGPVQLTAEGAALLARLGETMAELTGRLYAGFDPDDLATAHRVLAEVTERANQLRSQP